ncbi:MAG: SIMPL domain-containing protein [Pseudomonadota bacterium]
MRLFPILAATILASAACAAPTTEARAAAEPTARTITVAGEGKVSARPDLAVLSIGVQTEGKTAGDAMKANASAMSATIEEIKSQGIEAKDIQTSGLSVSPRYDYERRQSPPALIGFAASNQVTVRIRNLDAVGPVVDASISAGANTLNGLSFGFADPETLLNDARRKAVSNAKARASLYADEADVSLGDVLIIQEGYAHTPGPRPMAVRAMSMEAADATPIEAGESELTARVTIVYAID